MGSSSKVNDENNGNNTNDNKINNDCAINIGDNNGRHPERDESYRNNPTGHKTETNDEIREISDDHEEREESTQEEPVVEETENKTTNSYASKKLIAQGMLDVALTTANANQLRYVLGFGAKSYTYHFVIALISISLLLQVVVGIALIFKSRMKRKGRSKEPLAEKVDIGILIAILLITIVNIFITSFAVTEGS